MAVDINVIITQVKGLSREHKEMLLREVSRDLDQAERRHRLIEAQRGKPFGGLDDFDEDVWPEDESAEEFVRWSRAQREADLNREREG